MEIVRTQRTGLGDVAAIEIRPLGTEDAIKNKLQVTTKIQIEKLMLEQKMISEPKDDITSVKPPYSQTPCYASLLRGKSILDACCGGKMFWFDKADPEVLFQDRRKVKPISVGKGKNARMFECSPDVMADFRDMPYPNNHFKLVVFDPPHFTSLGEKSYMAIKYGKLNKETWKEDITKGFAECFRVLKEGGILIFKWNEHDIRLSEILKCTPHRPLFGHPSGKTQKTHWVCFIKAVSCNGA